MMGWRERAPQQVAAAVAATSRSNTTTTHSTGSPLVGCSSVSHRTNTKATAAASRPRRATATWYGLRPFAHPRSLIPPKSHAALVSFNQQYQPSLEANLAGLPMLLAVARRCRAAATVATMDAIDGTLAAFSITRLTSSYT